MTPEERIDLSRCRNDLQREEIESIRDDGCFFLTVADPEGTSWNYTMGLWHTYQHPEVILIGMPVEHGHVYLDNIHYDITNHGKSFRDGTVANDVIEGFECFFQTIAPQDYGEWFAANQWFYDGDDFPAVQMIWPNIHGVYPWQNAASTHFKEAQPILSSLPKRFRN